jgi:uncharacterized membrane protein
VIGAVVEWGDLGKVVVASLVAGVGVTTVFAISIHGAVRFVDSRRDGRPLEAWGYATLTTVSLLVCVTALVLGIIVMSR